MDLDEVSDKVWWLQEGKVGMGLDGVSDKVAPGEEGQDGLVWSIR